ncbi:hypothetical protein JCM5353_001952 [Sporobolomyces roseus]
MSAPTDSTQPSPLPSSEMISLGLSRITKLLQAIKSPHLKTPIVHIAGTNGKGSVSAYLASILHTANLRVGRFNSPHLVDEWDCVRLEEKVVDEKVFRAAKEEVQTTNSREGLEATPFEILTATAYSLFSKAKLDIAVIEVGMGGEGDATNVVPASKTLLSILTAVDLDHQGFLGNTVGEIAKVKSGIVREGGDLVLAPQAYSEVEQVAKEVARERRATVWSAQSGSYLESTSDTSHSTSAHRASLSLSPASSSPSTSLTFPATPILASLPLPGSYQLDNSATALLAAQLLRSLPRTTTMIPQLAQISDDSLREGIERTRWDGRLQWIDLPHSPESSPSSSTSASPTASRRILLDGAHNPSSAKLLASYLSSLPPSSRPATLVFGLSAPRAAADVLRPLLEPSTGINKVVCVEFSPPVGMPWVRATSAAELSCAVKEMAVAGITVEDSQGLESALLRETDEGASTILAGSLYLVADALRIARRSGIE